MRRRPSWTSARAPAPSALPSPRLPSRDRPGPLPLRNALTNPWLASIVSFIPVIALLAVLWLCQPRPMPTIEGISSMPWWAPLGGVVGAFAVIAGLLFVDKVGAGALAGLTITANILMSLVIDHFGLFGVHQHSLSPGRAIGATLMVGGITLISKF
jgi:bacterial/archaeal transporter family-2 protein